MGIQFYQSWALILKVIIDIQQLGDVRRSG